VPVYTHQLEPFFTAENYRTSFSSLIDTHLKELDARLATRFGPNFLELLLHGLRVSQGADPLDYDVFVEDEGGRYKPGPRGSLLSLNIFALDDFVSRHEARRPKGSKLRLVATLLPQHDASGSGRARTRQEEVVPLLGPFNKALATLISTLASQGKHAEVEAVKDLKGQIDRKLLRAVFSYCMKWLWEDSSAYRLSLNDDGSIPSEVLGDVKFHEDRVNAASFGSMLTGGGRAAHVFEWPVERVQSGGRWAECRREF